MKSPIQALAGRPIGGSPCRSQRPKRGPIILAATYAAYANGNKRICVHGVLKDIDEGNFQIMMA